MDVSDLINALPDPNSGDGAGALPLTRTSPSQLRVPLGRWKRLSLLGSLHAKIAAGYLFQWCRGWFMTAGDRKRLLAESHWRNAVRVLDSMGYMRGAIMKIGQAIANYPEIAPTEFVETLHHLHFNAPSLHWSLLQEMVHNELGDDPDALFAAFDRHAFAAASLGQVHRARMFTGEEVAVKIQYPGIAQAIQDDVRNLTYLLLPSRLTADWEFLRCQLDDLTDRLKNECDYEMEASVQNRVRSLFLESEGIRVPRIYPQFSSSRVLTMEYLPGITLSQFLKSDPPDDVRNEIGRKLTRAHYRMWCSGRLGYVDFHPGNTLILENQEIGLVDFGMVWLLDDNAWDFFRRHDEAFTTGRAELLNAANAEWCNYRVGIDSDEMIITSNAFADWQARPRRTRGEYDFGNASDFLEGVELFLKLVKLRFVRAHPASIASIRMQMGLRAILHHLRAKIDVYSIAEEEVVATGWDRRAYANPLGP